MSPRKKVVVAMSGGVDSSVAAALLQKQGYDCIGVFMRLGSGDDADHNPELVACSPDKQAAAKVELPIVQGKAGGHQGCCSLNDAADARYVAGLLDIPFYALNFQSDFGQIIDYFVAEYNAGRTPNPCIRCNEYLKFGKLARYAKAIGADYVASGHYAQVRKNSNGRSELLRGHDLAKDQSYVLFGVPKDELDRMLLPIGEMDKSTVRHLAEEFKLPVFNKPDSQEICFVPDNDYRNLLKKKTPEAFHPGEFVDSQGKVLGKHEGYQYFTLGQRKGMKIALGFPAYVTAIDPKANRVTLGSKENLIKKELIADEVNWLADDMPLSAAGQVVMAKVRYNSPPSMAMAYATDNQKLRVVFDEGVAAITPGQAVVCYGLPQADGTQRLFGGGWIRDVIG